MHLDRQIDLQKSRLTSRQQQGRDEEVRVSRLRDAAGEVSIAVEAASKQAKADLCQWKDAVAELHRKDSELQVAFGPALFLQAQPQMSSPLVKDWFIPGNIACRIVLEKMDTLPPAKGVLL